MSLHESSDKTRPPPNEHWLEAVLQALPLQMAVLETDGTIVFVNTAWQAFARANGAAALAETSVGLNYLTVCGQATGAEAASAAAACAGITAVLAGTQPLFTLEYPCHSPEEQRWFLLYATPLGGRPGHAVVAHLLITQRKLLEERVSAANQEMSDFLSLVSHEVRTPLTSIKGYGQLVQLRLQRLTTEVLHAHLSPEQLAHRLTALQQSLELVESPIRRLNRLLEDLGEVAQIQSDRLQLARIPCDLGSLIWEAVEEQQLAWPNRSLDLQLPEQRIVVLADQDRLGQVVTNYLTNALKYGPADRPIHVGLQQEADQVKVQVRDQGRGLPPEERERIWDRFYRVSGTSVPKQAGGNLGMGLSICRSIIAQHGGQTGVESAPDAGNTFWFTLPLERASANEE